VEGGERENLEECIDLLMGAGVGYSREAADMIARREADCDPGQVRRQIQHMRWIQENRPGECGNPAGWLRRAIRDGWEIPPDMIADEAAAEHVRAEREKRERLENLEAQNAAFDRESMERLDRTFSEWGFSAEWLKLAESRYDKLESADPDTFESLRQAALSDLPAECAAWIVDHELMPGSERGMSAPLMRAMVYILAAEIAKECAAGKYPKREPLELVKGSEPSLEARSINQVTAETAGNMGRADRRQTALERAKQKLERIRTGNPARYHELQRVTLEMYPQHRADLGENPDPERPAFQTLMIHTLAELEDENSEAETAEPEKIAAARAG